MAGLDDFMDVEDRDGARLAWNVLPVTADHEKKMVIPVGVIYSPLKKAPQPPPLLQYDPVICKGPCRTVLNPFCSVDIAGRLWVCPFCYQRNSFPPRYGNLQSQPPELVPRFTTVEYRLSKPYSPPPAFLFVVDLALEPKALQNVKDSLLMAISLMPENCHVGLITFSETVKIYELAFESCPKSYVFSGKKEVEPKILTRMLGMTGAPVSPVSAQAQSQPSYRFILPLSECQLTLENIIESFVPNSWPPKKACRPLRSTGSALSIAVSLLENLRLSCAARIMCFLGGPATNGPGMVVEPPLKNPMRAHYDLEKDNAKFSKDAYKFYDKQAQRACLNGHIIDILAGCLDQVGTMEMRQLVQKTGGYLVNAESFEHQMFKDSFRKMFQRDGNGNLNMGFNVTTEVQMSKEMKVMGAIGHLVSMKKSSPAVSAKTVGESGTSAWKICGIDPQTTYAFYFTTVSQDQMPKRNQRGLIQFTTSYMDSSGAHILRVTTIGRPFVTGGVPGQQDAFVDPNPKAALSAGFDQEAAAVLLARMAVFKTRDESPFDVIRWLDRTLISVTQQFGEYMKGDASSFRLGRSFGLLPQFMFHLRRSCLLQNFNNSPDESTYYRFMLLRETCPNSMTMIQPRLEAYTMQDKGFPVLLSSTSLAADRILMLDTFFHLVVWHGKTISDWKAKGYQNDPNYGAFRLLLEAPQEDAKYVLEERIPTPMFKSCAHNHGDARYLLAVIDPAMTYSSNAGGVQQGGEVIPTDDANLQVFVEHLAKLTVQKN